MRSDCVSIVSTGLAIDDYLAENRGCSAKSDWPAKADLFGIGVSCVTIDAACEAILRAARLRESTAVSAFSVHALIEVVSDARLADKVNNFAMITPDGQPVRWALNWLYSAWAAMCEVRTCFGRCVSRRLIPVFPSTCMAARARRLPYYERGWSIHSRVSKSWVPNRRRFDRLLPRKMPRWSLG